MPRISDEEFALRVVDAEDHLLILHNPVKVQKVLSEKYSCHVKTVRTWIKRVRQKWAAEAALADPVERNTRRGEMRATLRVLLLKCLNADDMQNAAKFCKLLIDFDALNEAPEIRVNGTVHHEVNLRGREALEQFLLSGAKAA